MKGLAIWGLSDTSFPYKGYVIVDLEFPEDVTGIQETVSVMALVCPESRGLDNIPIMIGTNVSMFGRLTQTCREMTGPGS